MKTLFFGTPALAVPYLELLADQTELKAVVTTSDEPAGRGYELKPPPVKQTALALNLPVLQPANINDPGFLSQIQAFSPDVVIVVAYGKILPAAVLKVPKHGFINVHFSLLPAYRGAAPIQRVLMNGEKKTGVTLFWLDEGMDTGPVFLQKNLPILDEDDAESLRPKLMALGLEALKEALSQIEAGRISRQPQTDVSSAAPSLKKEEGRLHWTQSAQTLANLIRGTNPWPGAFTFVLAHGKSQRLKVLKASVLKSFEGLDASKTAEPGSVVGLDSGRGFIVKCGQDFLHISHVQPEGKRPMSAWDYWQGARMKIGEKLG